MTSSTDHPTRSPGYDQALALVARLSLNGVRHGARVRITKGVLAGHPGVIQDPVLIVASGDDPTPKPSYKVLLSAETGALLPEGKDRSAVYLHPATFELDQENQA